MCQKRCNILDFPWPRAAQFALHNQLSRLEWHSLSQRTWFILNVSFEILLTDGLQNDLVGQLLMSQQV